jgi:serine phosphatase RsbU (regulator of sigma subunit)
MRVLVGWDAVDEADTISLLLGVEESPPTVTTDPAEFLELLRRESWDVALMALNFPSHDEAFDLFLKARELAPNSPILGAYQQGDVAHLAQFIIHGLHSYIARDAAGEFILLLSTIIESAYTAMQAQRTRQLTERLREEIDSVRKLQESVIPRDLPTWPQYRVVGRYEPAPINVRGSLPVAMAGGDYYDAFSMEKDTMVLLVGDAAGHGMKACMSIMTMHTLVHMIRDQRYQNTAEFVAEVNRRVSRNTLVQSDGGFITLLYCSLNTKEHQMQWTSAGHPMPLLHDLTTNEVRPLGSDDASGLPLGIETEWDYELLTADIPPNSRLLLYTDGLAEAMYIENELPQQFDLPGIIDSLKRSRDLPLEQVLEQLFADSHAYTQGLGRADDTSVVLVERLAEGSV